MQILNGLIPWRWHIVSGLALVVMVGVLHFYFGFWHTPQGETTFHQAYDITLKNYAGEDVQLSDYKRTVLIVYMWASWCPYCDEELEHLAELMATYGDDISVVAVNRAESLGDARAFSDKIPGAQRITFLLDPADTLFKQIEGYAMPETLFINRWGDIVFHQRGPIQLEDVRANIGKLME